MDKVIQKNYKSLPIFAISLVLFLGVFFAAKTQAETLPTPPVGTQLAYYYGGYHPVYRHYYYHYYNYNRSFRNYGYHYRYGGWRYR